METRTNTSDAPLAYLFIAPGDVGYCIRLAASSFDA